MTDFQVEKQLVLAYYKALEEAAVENLPAVLDEYCSADLTWHSFYPFDQFCSCKSVATEFWQPLRQSLTGMQRRMDVFFAGQNSLAMEKDVWVVSMGHLMGLFDKAWLGITPTGKLAFLRYCAFHRVVDGQIVETAMYFDIPHLMVQAGKSPFQSQSAAHLVQPGPQTHTGLMFKDAQVEEGQRTLSVINAMISDLGQWDNKLSLEEELAQTWHDDMIWWGPEGIGATYTIERYAKQHSGPFRAGFTDRSKTNHICRLAEGEFGGFFGYPNFTARPTGGFMGLPAYDKPCEFRVIDIYRRDKDKLAENWVFIDILYFLKQQGIDLLAHD
ncbi:ester cyclase [Polycladidibacter hongkongensis]|uniref:ester cyclase n=1 Tax=Polycladidibacter hongkongensis TaxID=1647556 RepID=UPI000B0A3894|nr:ester cyclase [Pseudovibrio hongkongensis]